MCLYQIFPTQILEKNKIPQTVEDRITNMKENLCLSDFEILCEIGSGTNGTVYKAKLSAGHILLENADSNSTIFAIKKISLGDKSKDTVKEVFMLKNITHPNIIKCYASFIEDENLYIVMEYAEGGDLLSLILKQKEAQRYFSEQSIWKYAWQICCGMLHMHAQGIIHRDIKALNILISNGVLKIGDLGESRFLKETDYLHGKQVGTPMFLAPEVIKHENYDHRVDIWALGCVLYHIAALDPPFPNPDIDSLLSDIKYKSPKPLPGIYSSSLESFISKCLSKKISDRPFINHLIPLFPNHTFTNYIDLKNYKNMQKSNEGKNIK